MVYKWLVSAQVRLFPPLCLLCRARTSETDGICPGCREGLPLPGRTCPRCAAVCAGPGLCGRCQRRLPAFDATLAAFPYAPPIAQLVHQLKYHRRLDCGRLLGLLLAEAVERAETALPELIVPVPLHSARLRRRGYNQALEIARPLSRRLGVPLATRAARRLRPTPPQTELAPRSRRRNVHGAFSAADVDGTHVAVVDDVMTTGSTVDALAHALHQAGAEKVEVWVVARA
jgi:ComF family protein